MESLNRMATELVDEAIDFADELRIAVQHLENDAVVLDFGVEASGGFEAGLLLAEIQTGGLATVSMGVDTVAKTPLPHVELTTDHPLLALLCSGMASWTFSAYDGIGSGPARLCTREGPEFASLDYEETFEFAVLCLESEQLPAEAEARAVAERAGVGTSGVFLPTASVSSPAGSVAVAAQAAEVAVFRLHHLGYDPSDIVSVTAKAPVPPLATSEVEAIGRSNDAIAYGSHVHLIVESEADCFESLPFDATDFAGDSFVTILPDGQRSFPSAEDAFAPAAVTIDVRNGPTYSLGSTDEDRLADLLGV